MRIISFIEDSEIIKKILKHLDLWDVRSKPPARAHDPPTEAFIIYDKSSSPNADDYLIDANYPMETYLQKIQLGQTGELCPNLPESSIPPPKIDIDNRPCFRYLDGYWFS